MTCLATVHPDGFSRRDLEHHHRGRADSVVGIRHEARVDAALHGHTGLAEGGLCDRVVLRHEVKLDHITRSGLDGIRGVDKTSVSTNSHLRKIYQKKRNTRMIISRGCFSPDGPYQPASSGYCNIESGKTLRCSRK